MASGPVGIEEGGRGGPLVSAEKFFTLFIKVAISGGYVLSSAGDSVRTKSVDDVGSGGLLVVGAAVAACVCVCVCVSNSLAAW